jgi:hypothetical protein
MGDDDPQEELANREKKKKILLNFGELLEPKCLYMTILGKKKFPENIRRLWRIFSQNFVV